MVYMQSLLNKLVLFIYVVIQVLALNRGDEHLDYLRFLKVLSIVSVVEVNANQSVNFKAIV